MERPQIVVVLEVEHLVRTQVALPALAPLVRAILVAQALHLLVLLEAAEALVRQGHRAVLVVLVALVATLIQLGLLPHQLARLAITLAVAVVAQKAQVLVLGALEVVGLVQQPLLRMQHQVQQTRAAAVVERVVALTLVLAEPEALVLSSFVTLVLNEVLAGLLCPAADTPITHSLHLALTLLNSKEKSNGTFCKSSRR
jgi:hypothetical protein